MTYTVMVTGSRTWVDEDPIRRDLELCYHPGARLIHGQCPKGGADLIADRIGRELGYDVQPFPPAYPFPAYFHMRNDQMLNELPDIVLAYWDGKSSGTKSVIDKARRQGLWLRVRQEALP